MAALSSHLDLPRRQMQATFRAYLKALIHGILNIL